MRFMYILLIIGSQTKVIFTVDDCAGNSYLLMEYVIDNDRKEVRSEHQKKEVY